MRPKVADRTFYRKLAWLCSIPFWNPSFRNPRSATARRIQSIKPEQLEIVAVIVKGDEFAVFPTGYGMLSVFTEAL